MDTVEITKEDWEFAQAALKAQEVKPIFVQDTDTEDQSI